MKLNEMTLEELEQHKLATQYKIDHAKGFAKNDLIKHYNKVCCRIYFLKNKRDEIIKLLNENYYTWSKIAEIVNLPIYIVANIIHDYQKRKEN